MAKNIMKEAGIVILLLIAVALLLAIVFYEYIPNDKTVPIKIQAYEFPEDIQQELQNSISGEQNIVRTFYIDSSDLDLYEATNDYDKGKANPFADYSIKNTNTVATKTAEETNTTNSSNTSQENGTGGSTNSNSNATTNVDEQNEVYINTPGKNY